jgi:protein phosphatase
VTRPDPIAPPLYDDRVLRIEPGSVLVTVGSSGSGKTDWAERNFRPEQVLGMDRLRRLVSGTDTDDGATAEAFDVLLRILEPRARRGLTTVLDGTFLEPEARARILEICRRHGRPAVAVCFHIPAELAQYRNRAGSKPLGGKQLRAQVARVREFTAAHVGAGPGEGWSRVVFFGDVDTDLLPVIRFTLPPPLPYAGPFDVIGDVHGCLAELDLLLDRLGYRAPNDTGARIHPQGRIAVLVGDFADRGPESAGVFRRVMAMHARGSALAVPGNHCIKLLHYLRGNHVDVRSGLGDTLRDLDRAGQPFRERVRDFLGSLPRHLILAGGRLVVFHAALPRDRVGRDDQATEAQIIYGVAGHTGRGGVHQPQTGWTSTWTPGVDEPVAVYGHEPVPEPLRADNTINIDGGCVYGGYLAAFRWPERDFVYVSALRTYSENPRVDWRGAPRV